MATIQIKELEVCYRLGVTDEERVSPQRLLLSVVMDVDATRAEKSDNVRDTVDYFAVAQRLLRFGEGRSWKLIERLAAEIAGAVLTEFKPQSVEVEVRKYVIPEARYVSVRCRKPTA